eukprot:5775775-Amphidinium_carterae.1
MTRSIDSCFDTSSGRLRLADRSPMHVRTCHYHLSCGHPPGHSHCAWPQFCTKEISQTWISVVAFSKSQLVLQLQKTPDIRRTEPQNHDE